MLPPPFAMTADEIVPNKVGSFPTNNQIIMLPSLKFCYFRRRGAEASASSCAVGLVALRQGPKSGVGAKRPPPEGAKRQINLRLFGETNTRHQPIAEAEWEGSAGAMPVR